ncbi:hypothetical protein, partial [Marinitenerispora sediminis]
MAKNEPTEQSDAAVRRRTLIKGGIGAALSVGAVVGCAKEENDEEDDSSWIPSWVPLIGGRSRGNGTTPG